MPGTERTSSKIPLPILFHQDRTNFRPSNYSLLKEVFYEAIPLLKTRFSIGFSHVSVRLYKQAAVQADRRIHGQMIRWKDEQTDRESDGQTGRESDGPTSRWGRRTDC